MSLSLWYPHGNGRAAKVLIAAEIAGIALEHKNIDYENLKTPEFLGVNPFGRVPTLETPEGPIFESFAILRYIARKSNTLFGKSAWEQAQIENWLNLSLSELDPFVINYVCSVIGYEPLTKDRFNQITKTLKDWAKSFDEHLNGKAFIVGDSLSIADISVASYFFWLLRLLFEEKTRAQLPNVLKWYESVSALPQFQSVLGKTWYAQKEFTPASFVEEEEKKQPVKAEKAEKAEKTEKVEKAEKTEKAPKQEKPKQEKPKQEKQPEKPKEEKKKDKKKKDSDEEEQDEVPVEKKAANPLDLLPKSTFVMDDFKREISNNPDKNESVRLFWEKYDPQGWSIWKCRYDKYEGEGTVGYLTSNLKNGYVRNLDHFRKYCFAAFGVYGVEGDYDIRGVFFWRGTEIPFEVSDHQSGDYYKFTKLDHTKEEDRKLLEDYWTHLEEGQIVDGKPIYDVKYFK